MKESLSGKKVAILATDSVEQSELAEPKKDLEGAGAATHVVAPRSGEIRNWHNHEWGEKIRVGRTLHLPSPQRIPFLALPPHRTHPC